VFGVAAYRTGLLQQPADLSVEQLGQLFPG
jgi:hypothetical protein